MLAPADAAQMIERRDPNKVMRLARLGCFHQSRLSFMRILLRRIQRESWSFSRPVFEINELGVGHAVYQVQTPLRVYSLVVFAHDLPAEKRSDRVIAEAWDATFTLFDGVPSTEDISRLSKNVPKQEAGRLRASELSLSRANRSVRLWEHVVSALAAGVQPDREQLQSVGYLMRTTAVYGSGKFGASDREAIADREEFNAPFQVELLSVYLTRLFVRDLVEHMASMKGGASAVPLDKAIAQSLGIGNSTGLGMAPFIINHPVLFNNWIAAREEALRIVRRIESVEPEHLELFKRVFNSSCQLMLSWKTDNEYQRKKIVALHHDIIRLSTQIEQCDFSKKYAWNILYEWAENNLELEAQEFLVSLLYEPYGHLVDGMEHCMMDDGKRLKRVNGNMSVGELKAIIEQHYAWALRTNWNDNEAVARAWYVSAEKLEPRLGERFDEPLVEYEQPLAPARDAAKLYDALCKIDTNVLIAEFLLTDHEHRDAVLRAQTVNVAQYAEIRDNTISAKMLPVDMLRCKLSFFGAMHFDPRSDRWVRICMYLNAPYPEDLTAHNADYWVYPGLSS